MSVATFSIIDLMRDQLKARGVPVRVLTVDHGYELRQEPDVRVVPRSWSGLRQDVREETFTAPLFRWDFEDGRRFQGRPDMKVKRGEWRCLFAGGETATADSRPMLQQVSDMIRRSFENGAD